MHFEFSTSWTDFHLRTSILGNGQNVEDVTDQDTEKNPAQDRQKQSPALTAVPPGSVCSDDSFNNFLVGFKVVWFDIANLLKLFAQAAHDYEIFLVGHVTSSPRPIRFRP